MLTSKAAVRTLAGVCIESSVDVWETANGSLLGERDLEAERLQSDIGFNDRLFGLKLLANGDTLGFGGREGWWGRLEGDFGGLPSAVEMDDGRDSNGLGPIRSIKLFF